MLKDIATQSLALLAVAVLLLSSAGPMFDHHFPERHPAHVHLYLGIAEGDHSHPFEHSHVHYDAMYAPASSGGDAAYFAPSDGAGRVHADAAALTPTSLPRFRDGGGLPPGRVGDTTDALRGITTAPLRQPPRA